MKKENIWRKMGKRAVELLFPRRCPVCDDIVRNREGLICRECRDRLEIIKEPFCLRCGRPLPGERNEYCSDCDRSRHLFVRGRALYAYRSAARSIYRFKYGGRREYAAFFGREMADKLGEFIRRAAPDGLVPVPISRKRKNRRGYNQAALLAKEIGSYLKLPVYDHLVVRCRDTVPQKELNARERQNNLKKAFKIAENDVKLSTIIIIDDIYTTGSTVDAVAGVLLASGVERIYFIALAVGAGQ